MMDKMGMADQMKEFEKVFEDMDVKTGEMDAAMDNVYEGTIDANAVNQLLQEVQEGVGLEGAKDMSGVVATGKIAGKVVAQPVAQADEMDDMEKRMAALNAN